MRKTLFALSKNLLIKVLIVLIIGVFALWGVGDMFSAGKTNVVAEVYGKNIYTQEFINEFRRELQVQNISNGKEAVKNRLHFKILNSLIANKIIEIYAEEEKIIISDKALASFLKQIPDFQENKEFSRTKYEKYLLQNGVVSSEFENNFKKNLLRQIIIDSQSSGVSATTYHAKLVGDYFTKQALVKYINLNPIYDNHKSSEDEIQEYYKKNPIYTDEYRSIKYSVIGLDKNSKEGTDQFFKKISAIENEVLSNKSYNEIIEKFSLTTNTSSFFNLSGMEKDTGKNIALDKKIIQKSFNLGIQINSELLEVENSFYLISMNKIIDKKPRKMDKNTKNIVARKVSDFHLEKKILELKNTIKDTKSFGDIEEKNKSLTKELFIKSRFEKNLVFSPDNIQAIFELGNNELVIINDKNNYLVKMEKTSFDNKKTSEAMNKLYEKQAAANFQDQIIMSFDKFLNNKYNIKINQKVLDRITNSF